MSHEVEHAEPQTLREDDAPIWTPAVHRRVILAAIVALCIVLLVVVPPYVSVSRYQRKVASAISGALGRPVHFDNISLQLLPVPGLTIQNFTVNEDPAFGAEPVLRSSTVTARLRLRSLWRRRVEVSRISLDAPSVNLVRRPADGKWNLQGILQQASYLNSAPTAQAHAGDAPRFPYIEATGARINFKNGIDKLPFSIRETDFALWLPQPNEWHLRLSGRPVRTDTDVSDIGLLKVEGTLGRANDLQTAPIDLSASWKRTPLGEAAKLTAGYDLGWRGDASADATLHGTVAQTKLVTDLHLLSLRRADFFPEHPLEVQAHCEATVSSILRSASDVRCAIPTDNSRSLLSVIQALGPAPAGTDGEQDSTQKPGVLVLIGKVDNLLNWRTISGTVSLTGASPDYALAWMRLFSRRIPPDLSVSGTMNLNASTTEENEGANQWSGTLTCECTLPDIKLADGALAAKRPSTTTWFIAVRHDGTDAHVAADALSLTASLRASSFNQETEGQPKALPTTPAIVGQMTTKGYTLTYDSPGTVRAVTAVLPQLGDNMPDEDTGELQAQHTWNTAQTWTPVTPARNMARRGRRRRR